MPCRYDEPDSLDDSLDKAKKELDKLTRLLCEACRTGSPGSGESWQNWSPELRDWWAKHQKADENRRRVEAEKLRKRKIAEDALGKLSDEEIAALGIKMQRKSI